MFARRTRKVKDVQMGYLHQEIKCIYCDKKVYSDEPTALVIYEKDSDEGDNDSTAIHCVDCLEKELLANMRRIDLWAEREKDKFSRYNIKFNEYRNSDLKKKLDIVRNLEINKKEDDD
jgi:hypothetical protein